MSIILRTVGGFRNIKLFFKSKAYRKQSLMAVLHRYGQMGTNALMRETPVDSGRTARSWYYEIVRDGDNYSIQWHNNNTIRDGTPIVILLVFGHGTGNGGYVVGNDFVTPTLKPILDGLTKSLWEEVKR
jgi:hypothetical protein